MYPESYISLTPTCLFPQFRETARNERIEISLQILIPTEEQKLGQSLQTQNNRKCRGSGGAVGRVRLDLALQQSIPCLVQTSCRPLPAPLHSQHRQDRIAVDHCERPLLQFDNFSLVSVKNGTCIQSLRALSDSPLSYDVTHSLKHSDKFCDPVAFLDREEPGWRNPLVQQSFY